MLVAVVCIAIVTIAAAVIFSAPATRERIARNMGRLIWNDGKWHRLGDGNMFRWVDGRREIRSMTAGEVDEWYREQW